MNKAELEKLIDRYGRKAEVAFQNFQETGMTRYDTARRNAEDMADALSMALGAEADHSACISMRCSISLWATKAKAVSTMDTDKKAQESEAILSEIIAFACMHNLVRDDGR